MLASLLRFGLLLWLSFGSVIGSWCLLGIAEDCLGIEWHPWPYQSLSRISLAPPPSQALSSAVSWHWVSNSLGKWAIYPLYSHRSSTEKEYSTSCSYLSGTGWSHHRGFGSWMSQCLVIGAHLNSKETCRGAQYSRLAKLIDGHNHLSKCCDL